MEEWIRFGLLGLGLGALYSLASQGLVLVYRGSGVLNFAHGAIGMVGAYITWELQTKQDAPFIVAFVIGVAVSAAIGAFTHLVIMRRLRQASPLARIAITLGVLVTLQSLVVLRYSSDVVFPSSALPTDRVTLWGDVSITVDRLILFAIAIATTAALWALYRYSRFGLATSAVAENERAAAALGWSPDSIATANWALGSALSGVAAVLISPIITLQVSAMTNLVLAAIAAALVAGFRSFPIACAAGVIMGIGQTEINRFVDVPGLGPSLPFLVIVVVLIARGQALPLRDYFLQKLPRIGSGRLHPVGFPLAIAIPLVGLLLMSDAWVDSITITLCVSLVLLSIVVLTGYAGQLSLAQFVIAGFGATVCAKLVNGSGMDFTLALILGVLGAVPMGIAFALPAVRTRGINLAIVTMGLGTAVQYLLFTNQTWMKYVGYPLPEIKFLGIRMDAIGDPQTYGYVTLGLCVVAVIVVANVRRGRSGRRMIAVRTNERAAAALGISVPGAKLYAFGLAGAVAGLGGILYGFRTVGLSVGPFTTQTSINDVTWAMIGGVGYLLGPWLGAILAPSAIGTQVTNSLFPNVDDVARYVPLVGGLLLIILMLWNQDGLSRAFGSYLAGARRFLARVFPFVRPRERRPEKLPAAERERVAAHTLEVQGLTVRYGTVVAVDDVSLRVEPGRILGLIGPNGAGKTTAIDGITGFTKPAAGTLLLDGRDFSRWSVVRRARAGISRSFQSLELFEDSTVLDNLRVASDPRDMASYLLDLVWPRTPPLPGAVVAAITEFDLVDDLHRPVSDLPYGKRRLLAIARAVALRPSVLLLDEPAAGLGDVESAELARLVRRLADDWGMAVLLIEHDMNFVMSVCDDIHVLDFGRTISEGTPDTVRRDPAVIAAYLGETEEELEADHGALAPPAEEVGR
jgi:sulfate-transporting ATPase